MVRTIFLLVLSGVVGCLAAPRTRIVSNDVIIAETAVRCRPGRHGCNRGFRAVEVQPNPLPGPEPNASIPQFDVGADGVSASIGGYHASAGLGGTLNGGPAGVLHAEAGIPGGTGAAAGLGGSVGSGGVLYSQAGVGGGPAATTRVVGSNTASTSASTGTGVYVPPRLAKRPPDFYDNIFNIPISVLQAVNQLLGGGTVVKNTPTGGSASAGGHASVGLQSRSASGSTASASTGSIVGSETFTQTKTSAGTAADGGGFFDSIFNIPISALKSVNQLLNNKNERRPEVRPPH